MLEERGPVIPGHVRRSRDHVIAHERADRDGDNVRHGQLLRQSLEILLQPQEDVFAVFHQIHFVDRHQDVGNSEQRRDVGVPPRLRENAFCGINQNHGQIGGGGAGRHVARVLLVAGRIGDDKFPAGRLEIAIGHVDGDALLAFGAQTVGEQRKIYRARRAIDAAVFYGGQLIFENGFGIVQESADQRGFAVVHAAGRRESKKLLRQILVDEGLEAAPGFLICGDAHQK